MVSRQETFKTHAVLKLQDSHMGEIHRKAIVPICFGNDIAVDPLHKGFMRSHPLPSRGGAGVGSVMSVMFFAATPLQPTLR